MNQDDIGWCVATAGNYPGWTTMPKFAVWGVGPDWGIGEHWLGTLNASDRACGGVGGCQRGAVDIPSG